MRPQLLLLIAIPSILNAQVNDYARILRVIEPSQHEIFYMGKNDVARLIGVSSPIKDRDATDFVKWNLSPGDTVWIELDSQYRDDRNRLLCYMHLSNGKILNEEIIKAGYSKPDFDNPLNTKYLEKFVRAYSGNKKISLGGGPLFNALGNENLKFSFFGLNLFFDYSLLKSLSLRTSIGGNKTTTKSALLYSGDYSLLWIEESLVISWQRTLLRPHAGVGIGYYLPNYESNLDDDEQFLAAGFFMNEIENSLSMNVFVGLNYWLPPNKSIELQFKYLPLRPKYSLTARNLELLKILIPAAREDTLDLKTLYVGVHFALIF